MRIQTNVTAMNTHRMYTLNNSNVSKSAEKLSSGYRINRAGDDAAGLAISEKMRAQVKGLSMASKNSQDAISLIQTAEGALQEVHTMLQRMNELSVQSATGTNEDFDRAQIDAEFNQLKNEIDDIAKTTNFNNMKLLDGSLASDTAKVAITDASRLQENKSIQNVTADATVPKYTVTKQTGLSAQKGTYTITDKTGGKINVAFTDATNGNVTNTEIDLNKAVTGDLVDGGAFKVDLSAAGLGTYEMTAVAGSNATVSVGTDDLAAALGAQATPSVTTISPVTAEGGITAGLTVSATSAGAASGHGAISYTAGTGDLADAISQAGFEDGETITLSLVEASATSLQLQASNGNGKTVTLGSAVTIDAAVDNAAASSYNFGGYLTVSDATLDVTTPATASVLTDVIASIGTVGTFTISGEANPAQGGLKIQVGAEEGDQLDISIAKMNSAGLGLTAVSISDQEKASTAISATRDAINMVSEQRATLGAMQNRLDYKISNLDNTVENLSAAESRIRDVDLAKEMTSYTKNNILSQAATAMLAQANAAPQNVLSLLQ